MLIGTFWDLIQDARTSSEGDCDREVTILRDKLVALPADEIASFSALFDEQRRRAHDYRLWAAAYIINAGCSDDCFEYFRAWLIGQGERIFEDALRNPDSLADLFTGDEDYVQCEAMLYVPLEAFQMKTGQELNVPWSRSTPTGVKWREDDLPTLLPRLASKFRWEL